VVDIFFLMLWLIEKNKKKGRKEEGRTKKLFLFFSFQLSPLHLFLTLKK